MGNVGNHIGCRAAGAAAYQHHTDGDSRRQGENFNEDRCQCRHDDELEKASQSHIFRLFEHVAEIAGGEAHAHAEHDDAQHDGNIRGQGLHDRWEEYAENAGQYYAYCHVAGTDTNDFINHGKLLYG